MLQPLDASLNRAFKTHIRHLWTHWMADGKAELTAKGNFERPSLPTVVSWVNTGGGIISQKNGTKILLEMLHQ